MSESLPRGRKGAREAGGDGDGAAGEACGRRWDEMRLRCTRTTAVEKETTLLRAAWKKKLEAQGYALEGALLCSK